MKPFPLQQCEQQALCIFDIFAAHRDERLLAKLKEEKTSVVFIPASCTDQLQPLDLKVNKQFKSYLCEEFNQWYAGEIYKCIRDQQKLNEIKIDLRASVQKPIHAKWLVTAVEKISRNQDLIRSSFQAAGISKDTE